MLFFPNRNALALLVLSISALHCIYAYVQHGSVGYVALDGNEDTKKGCIKNVEVTGTEREKTLVESCQPITTEKEKH
jgi:hypothetical protein